MLAPPFVIDEEQIDEMVTLFSRAVERNGRRRCRPAR